MADFDEAAWLEKLDKVQTTEELTALVKEIPLDPSDLMELADPESSITALSPAHLPTQKPSTSLVSNRLTDSELESLRQDQNEALDYAQRVYFPNARIHRAA